MCGIAGIVDLNDRSSDAERMRAILGHRGPDASTVKSSKCGQWHIHLIHTRLSIIDLESGQQPLQSRYRETSIVFNGEIYNHQDLRDQAQREGIPFSTQSDTESLLVHLERKGISGVADLNGFFAFAQWDPEQKKILLARDRSGIKPLYYTSLPGGGIAFASELKALLCLTNLPRRISPQALASFLYTDSVPAPQSFIEGVKKLPPAHSLVWQDGHFEEPRRYWQLPQLTGDVPPKKNVIESVRDHLEKAVERSLISDVPVGLLLSGGLDSSSLAAMVHRRRGKGFKTFSVKFDDPRFDESSYARQVAERVGSEHIETVLTEKFLLERAFGILESLDEPLADPSVIPTYLVCELASKHVKVVLGGDGGDELFGGYPTYKAHKLAQVYGHFPSWMRNQMIAPLVASLPVSSGYQPLEWKLKRFALNWDNDPLVCHRRWMSAMDLPLIKQALGVEPETMVSLNSVSGLGRLDMAMRYDFQSYLPDSVLTKVDRMSMRNGLEVRPPFLENQMSEWALALPASLKMKGMTTKHLLKEAMRGLLSDDVIDRPKRGFSVPLLAWQQGPLAEEIEKLMKDSPIWDWNLLNRAFYTQLLSEQKNGQANHARPLWALLVLDQWQKSLNSQLSHKQ